MFRVNHNQKLGEGLRGAIIAYTNADMSVSEISRKLGVSRPTVDRWQHRFEETGDVRNHTPT